MGAIAVLGATSWGLTLTWLLQRNGHDVTVIVRDASEAQRVTEADGIARLPDLALPSDTKVVPAPVPSIAPLEGLVVAVPAQAVRASLAGSGVGRDVPVLCAAKGIELSTGSPMTGVAVASGWPAHLVSVISGPNLAHEVVRGLPAAAVVAGPTPADVRKWQEALSGSAFRVYASSDVTGVELAGALKNVIAIAAGAAWGLDFGANAVAALMMRGLAEITRLGVALGAQPLTFQGLAGVGDLAATCFSPLSRNRRFGELLAAGKPAAEAQAAIGEAVEGAATAAVALRLGASLGVDMPITAEVASVIAGSSSVPDAMARLLGRPLRSEADFHP